MEMSKELPKPYINVLITYKTDVLVPDKYYGHLETQIVTRRAFYSTSKGFYNSKDVFIDTPDGYFSVPQYWQNYTFSNGEAALLPFGFYSYPRVYPKDIIDWKLDT